jgi:hypothetical protein
MFPTAPGEIKLSKLLAVEGKDCQVFMEALLLHLKISGEIEVRNFLSIQQMGTLIENLPDFSGFSNVTPPGIVRDAEQHPASSAMQSLCGSLRKADRPQPSKPMGSAGEKPRVTIYILPDCQNPGMLEDLCLQAVADDPAMGCVEEYLQCLSRQNILPANRSKARAHAFLASRARSDLQLGEAAGKGYGNWDSPAFDNLKAFLKSL